MSDDEDYKSSEDEDYVPSDGEAVSEEENSGEEENLDCLNDDGETVTTGKRKRKPKKAIPARKRQGGIKLDGEAGSGAAGDEVNTELQEQIVREKEMKKDEQEQKRKDNLWSSFMSDVGRSPPKKTSSPSVGGSSGINRPVISARPSAGGPAKAGNSSSKITVTKVYDFAGEAVKVTKEVDVNTKEGKAELQKLGEPQNPAHSHTDQDSTMANATATEQPSLLGGKLTLTSVPGGGVKRSGGLGGLLDKINKKPKIGTLEKSKLDWDEFKQKEGIGDELNLHNRSKASYIERMDFLSRSDQKQFEIEKSLRLSSSSKR